MAEPGSSLNSVVNLGMGCLGSAPGPVDRADIQSLVDWYSSSGIEPCIELCPYAHPSVARACAELGFILNPRTERSGAPRGFDTVLYRTLRRDEHITPAQPASLSFDICEIDPADSARVREFATVCATSDDPASGPPPAFAIDSVERCIRQPRTLALAAMLSDRIIGVGMVEIAPPHRGDAIAALFSAKVAPACRRRGVQQALLAARLNSAISRGATIATITSRPGIATERNVRRLGFQTACTKVILIRPGPGLAPAQ